MKTIMSKPQSTLPTQAEIARGIQKGRKARAIAVSAAFKSLFSGSSDAKPARIGGLAAAKTA